jgi:hypothetical protein
MVGKLSIALLIAASPALSAETAPAADAPAKPAYTTKKVCHTVEVAGSFIPRTSCVTKKIPIKKPETETVEAASSQSGASDGPVKEQ